MATFIAMLRGVNVGRAHRVPMAGFRDLLAGLGYADVVTLLNSGNAVFRSRTGTPAVHADRIAKGLARDMRVEVPVIVKSADDLAIIVAGNPIATAGMDPSRLLVAFAQAPEALARLTFIQRLVAAPEQFTIGRHAAYLYCAAGIRQSKAAEALLGRPGLGVTTRNLATTLKLFSVANSVPDRARSSQGVAS